MNTPSNIIKLSHKHIILPKNFLTNFIENNSNNFAIKTVTLSFKTVPDLLNTNSRPHIKSDAGVFSFLCKDSKLKHGRNFQKH